MRRYPFTKALRDAARRTIARGTLTLSQLAGMELDEFIQVCFAGVPRQEAWRLACANRVPSISTLLLWSRTEDDRRDRDQKLITLQRLQVHSQHLDILRHIRERPDINTLSEARRFAIEQVGQMEKPVEYISILPTRKTGEYVGPVRVEEKHRAILRDLEHLYGLSSPQARRLVIQMAGINPGETT